MRWPRRRRNCGLPRHFSPFTVPAMDFRVASNLASFRVAGLSESASCPASSRLRATPAGAVLGFPLVLHLPALPAMEPRVASNLASFGGADWLNPGSPHCSVLRYRRRSIAQVAPNSESSGTGWWLSRVTPGAFTFQLCQRRISGSLRIFLSPGYTRCVNFQVALAPHTSGGADWLTNLQVALNLRSVVAADGLISGSPRISFLRRSVYASSSCLDSAPTVGSMMNPRLSSNFASSGLRRGWIFVFSGSSLSCLALHALSISLDFSP